MTQVERNSQSACNKVAQRLISQPPQAG